MCKKGCMMCRRVRYGESFNSIEIHLFCTRLNKSVGENQRCKYFKRNNSYLSNGMATINDAGDYESLLVYKKGKFIKVSKIY